MAPTKGITLCYRHSQSLFDQKPESEPETQHPLTTLRMKEQKRLWYRKRKYHGC